jgi:hypothetical protein
LFAAARLRSAVVLCLCTLLLAVYTVQAEPSAAPLCSAPSLSFSHHYTYLVGSATYNDAAAETGSQYRWLVNGTELSSLHPLREGLLLHLDGSLAGSNSEPAPVGSSAKNVAFAAGKWGQALALPYQGASSAQGLLQYPISDNLFLDEGTLEMWLSPRVDGTDAVYQAWQALFYYKDPGGDYLTIASSNTGKLYVETKSGSSEISTGDWSGGISSWKAGEWHHMAVTYSTSGGYLRFYLDGVKRGEHASYQAPAAGGAVFTVGGSPWHAAAFAFDEVHLSGRAAADEEIALRAERTAPIRSNESWLPVTAFGKQSGASLVYEYTPASASGTGSACRSDARTYPGVPISDPQPPTTLLPVGATSFQLSVASLGVTQCGYAVGQPLEYAQMRPFQQGGGTTIHTTTVTGLSADPNLVNTVYVRCAEYPDFYLSLQYRSLSAANPRFPRTGNLWGWGELYSQNQHTLDYLANIDLWLGSWATGGQIKQMRQINPDIRVLTSINTVENNDLSDSRCNGCTGDDCEDWYLHDVHKERIEVWPGSWRINLTNPAVAEYQACYAYQSWIDSGLMADGVFFDNVMTTQSWQTKDIYGNPVQIDANNDGIADTAAELDAAWGAGVMHEIQTFRQMMPNAIVSGHSMNIYQDGISDLFNGISLGFRTANVLEGEETFSKVWADYDAWMTKALSPATTMFESSPVDQIAYGYDYSPEEKIPTSTLEFARSYSPWMRFGLALTLMNDGYFAQEFGDTWHGNDWWYDELNFDLGFPTGDAGRVTLPDFDPGPDLIVNPGFENPASIAKPWVFSSGKSYGCTATGDIDTSTAASGSASAHVNVTATDGTDWHVSLYQDGRSLTQGAIYDLTFYAKADRERNITLGAQKNVNPWDNYGLSSKVKITPEWRKYTVTFKAKANAAADARIQFFTGETTGEVWIDEVHLALHPPDVYRRDFTNGIALLNGTNSVQTVALEPGFKRLSGSQSPMFETILDDSTATAFSTPAGAWAEPTLDSGEWTATGPFYHAWNTKLHLSSGAGEAQWGLPITTRDAYTLSAWWPAAPLASTWSKSVTYEVWAGGQKVSTITLDQTAAGDEWHEIAKDILLDPADAPIVKLVCPVGAPCAADALYLYSQSRYNNGQPAETVTLQPLDGIILQRSEWRMFMPRISR